MSQDNMLFPHAFTNAKVCSIYERHCFCKMLPRKYNSSTSKIKKTSHCGIAARFVVDLVGNPKDRFSHGVALTGG